MKKIVIAALGSIALAAASVVYLTTRIAIGAGLKPGEVALVALMPLLICALLGAAAALGVRDARDRVAAMVATELQRKNTDADVTALMEQVRVASPTEQAERLTKAAAHTREASDRLAEFDDALPALRAEFQRKFRGSKTGRHRAELLDDTQQMDAVDRVDTEPKLYTHDELMYGGEY